VAVRNGSELVLLLPHDEITPNKLSTPFCGNYVHPTTFLEQFLTNGEREKQGNEKRIVQSDQLKKLSLAKFLFYKIPYTRNPVIGHDAITYLLYAEPDFLEQLCKSRRRKELEVSRKIQAMPEFSKNMSRKARKVVCPDEEIASRFQEPGNLL
jgi:hypothetical protein